MKQNNVKKNIFKGESFIAFVVVFFIFIFGFFAFVARASADYDSSLVHLWNFENTVIDVVNSATFTAPYNYKNSDTTDNYTLGRLNGSWGYNGRYDPGDMSSSNINYQVTNEGYTLAGWVSYGGKRFSFKLKNGNDAWFYAFNLGSVIDNPSIDLNGTRVWTGSEPLYNTYGSGWLFIAMTINSEEVAVYIDGELLTSFENQLSESVWKTNGVKLLAFSYANWTTPEHKQVDDISFWNKALTEDELLAIYNYNSEDNLYKMPIDEDFRLSASGGYTCSVGYTDFGDGLCILDSIYNNISSFRIKSPYNCINNTSCIVRYNYDSQEFTEYDSYSVYKLTGFEKGDFTTKEFVSSSTFPSINDEFVFNEFRLTNASSTVIREYFDIVINKAGYFDASRGFYVPEQEYDPMFLIVNWSDSVDYSQAENMYDLIDYVNAQRSTTTSEQPKDLLFSDAMALACSPEEWAEALDNNSFLGINSTRIKCQSLATYYKFLDLIKIVFKQIFNVITDAFSYVFPFTLPIEVNKAWNIAKNSTLPTDLEFLNMTTASSTLDFHFPKEWLMTESDANYTLFGKDMITSGNDRAISFFDNFKVFSKYLQWFLFMFVLIAFGRKVLIDLGVTENDIGTETTVLGQNVRTQQTEKFNNAIKTRTVFDNNLKTDNRRLKNKKLNWRI